VATCRPCRGPIVWMVTVKGRRVPVHAARGSDQVTRPLRVPDGNLALTGRYRRVGRQRIPEVAVVAPGQGAYVSHVGRCPKPRSHTPRETVT